MFPKQAVGSVVGIGGMMGAVGGMIISPLVGLILDKTGSYVPIFIIAASAYLDRIADHSSAGAEARASEYYTIGRDNKHP